MNEDEYCWAPLERENAALRAEVGRLNAGRAQFIEATMKEAARAAESRIAAATERLQAVAQALSDTHACDRTRIHNALDMLAAQPAAPLKVSGVGWEYSGIEYSATPAAPMQVIDLFDAVKRECEAVLLFKARSACADCKNLVGTEGGPVIGFAYVCPEHRG